MALETASRATENDLSGLRSVLMFGLLIGAAFFAGGVQHLRQNIQPVAAMPITQTENYRSGFSKGWSVSLTDHQLGRSSSPEAALRQSEIRESDFGDGFQDYRRGFVAGYADGWAMDHGPNAPKIPKTAELP